MMFKKVMVNKSNRAYLCVMMKMDCLGRDSELEPTLSSP